MQKSERGEEIEKADAKRRGANCPRACEQTCQRHPGVIVQQQRLMQGPRFALLLRKAHAVCAYGILHAGKVVGMTNEIRALAFFSRTGLRRQRVGVKGPGRVSAIHRVALSCPMVIAHAPGFSLISRKKYDPCFPTRWKT